MSAILETPELRYAEGRFNFAPGVKVVPTKFLTPGLVSYRDQAGGKVELLRKETIDEALASLEGNPVTIGHIAIEQAGDVDVANGHTMNGRFNADDGWFWCDSIVDTEKARQLLEDGQYPSCGYEVLSYGPGGVWQNMRYDREITGIRFNHMAIVERPRYTDSIFRLNSLPVTDKTMSAFTLLKKIVTKVAGVDTPTVTKHEVDGNSTIVVDGQEVRLNDMAATWMKQTAAAVTAGGEDEVMIEGCEHPVKLNELKECYRNAMAARKNETEMAEKKKKEEEEAAKKETERQNSLSAEQKAAEAQKAKDEADALARKNALEKESFSTLQSARFRTGPTEGYSTSSGSMAEKIERGKKRY